MKSLIPESINAKLDELVTKLFEGNRIADRGMSVLGVKFAMNKTEEMLHESLAHYFPTLADMVSSYQGSRNNLTLYGFTPRDDSDYASPLEFFEKSLEYMVDVEALISEIMEMTLHEDCVTFSFLVGFVKKIAEVTNQCLLLVDKAEQYKEDWKSFDDRIEDFIVL